MKIPTQEDLHKRFIYDPNRGCLLDAVNSKRCGSLHKQSCTRRIFLAGEYYTEHKLVWCLLKGAYPSYPIGHRNADFSDNRIENLYALPASQCRRVGRNNTSGVRGISQTASGKWRVYGTYRGKRIHIGYFDDFHEAVEAQQRASIDMLQSKIT